MSKTKIVSVTDSKIRIIGDNILYVNGITTAYYIMPLTNYSVSSDSGINYAIDGITNLISGLCSQRSELEFTIQRFSKSIKKEDVIKNLYSTIKLYAPDYDMPSEFVKNLSGNVREYCLFGVKINTAEFNNLEDASILDTAKQLFNNLANSVLNTNGNVLNEDKILQVENNIYSVLRTRMVRASKELVFYNYISKLYPCYDISYDNLGFVNEHNFVNILGSVTQTLEDNFGYFIMHNEGIDLFDLEPQDTYGCILNIKAFPRAIDSANFSMAYPGMQVNIKSIPKDKAAIQLKRTRSADKYELDEALKAGAELEQLEATSESIDIATKALSDLDEGIQMCEFNANILITGLSREDLKQNVQYVISDLKDRDILPQKSLTQALDFMDGYVKLVPKKYEHFTSLKFPLSFQLNHGALVGDSDGKFFVPMIGEDL